MKKALVIGMCALGLGTVATINAERLDDTIVVTSSNAPANQLLVYDTTGTLVQAVATDGQGGVGNNAGGIATRNGAIAVVNFGSQSVSIFDRGLNGFELRQVVPTVSSPVSVAFGDDHLYVLGTTTVESHPLKGSTVDSNTDGVATLLRADGSSAQVGVVADQLVITEKSGVIEEVDLLGGAVSASPVAVNIPAVHNDTPFGLATRGAKAYVTIAHSDEVNLIENGELIAIAAVGSDFPNGPGQQAPCWATLIGPYLFTSNSPSHSISRLVATGRNLSLEEPVAARTGGAPIDIAAVTGLLAVVEADGNGQSHLTQFRIDDDGSLVPAVTTPIASSANGVAILSNR